MPDREPSADLPAAQTSGFEISVDQLLSPKWKDYDPAERVEARIEEEKILGNYKISAGSDRGEQRDLDEDAYTIERLEDFSENLLILADGMGGHEAGDEVSQQAVKRLRYAYREERRKGLSPAEALEKAAQEANKIVYESNFRLEQDPKNPAKSIKKKFRDAGATLVAAVLNDNGEYIVGNVGDSRAYKINSQEAEKITTDHSVVERLISEGQITREDVYTHPSRNAIYRSLGDKPTLLTNKIDPNTGKEEIIEGIDIFSGTLGVNEQLLLCCDGLWEMTKDADGSVIQQFARSTDNQQEVVRRLLAKANQEGGEDNITVVIAKRIEPRDLGLTEPSRHNNTGDSLEPTRPAEPAKTTEPQLLTPEQQAEKWVRDKIARENAKIDTGQRPKWGGKPDVLIEFLRSRGVSQSKIMKWGSVRCFDEAAKILGLERKSLPRPESPEGEKLRHLEQRLEEHEKRITRFEEENKNLREENELLRKALINPEVLTDEEKKRLEGIKAEDVVSLAEEAERDEIKVETSTVDEEEVALPEKPEKIGFIAKTKNFFKNWWKGVSPQGRNKWCWGFGVAVGALEQLGLRPLLTPIIGPGAGWAVSGINAFAIQAVNYRLQKGMSEARASRDNERLRQIEERHSKFSDVVAGIAFGSLGSVVGSAIWEGFVAPKIPSLSHHEVIAAQPRSLERLASPAKAASTSTSGTEVLPSPITSPPVEKLVKYTVKPGDTVSEILAKMGHDPYGPDLTKLILENAQLLASKGGEYAKAVELVKAHPDWIARGGGTETWRTIMEAARLIHPGDVLKIP